MRGIDRKSNKSNNLSTDSTEETARNNDNCSWPEVDFEAINRHPESRSRRLAWLGVKQIKMYPPQLTRKSRGRGRSKLAAK